MRRGDFSPATRLVAMAVLEYLNSDYNHPRYATAWVSVTTLAIDLGLSRRTVTEAVRTFCGLWFLVLPREGTSHEFLPIWDLDENRVEYTQWDKFERHFGPLPEQNLLTPCAEIAHPLSKNCSLSSLLIFPTDHQKKDTQPSAVDPAIPVKEVPDMQAEQITSTEIADEVGSSFDLFWQSFLHRPRDPRQPALKAWKRLKPDERQRAIAACPAHAVQYKKEDRRFIPMAATWINQRRFDDEDTTPPKPRFFRP